ncbi:MAG: serine--tRNA ligase [candidate division Zixibacteria bacterium]|nr:serine--tRNA ligase [candidate division Zixibacteria bacterium]
MLDLKFIRENTDLVKRGVANKNSKVDIDQILDSDRRRRELLTALEALREKRNKVTGEIAVMKKNKQDASEQIAAMKAVGDQIAADEEKLRSVEDELNSQLMWVPNLPDVSTPIGLDESGNVIRRSWGEPKQFDFAPQAHWDLGAKLGMFDLERGSKISGSGFILYTHAGAQLERALINFFIDTHVTRHGYSEVFPPFMVNTQTMTGTGQLPKMAEDMYQLADKSLWLVPTAEVPVTNIYANEILGPKDVPKRLVAYTPCFRREAGAAGKDTRGLIRVHQFDKVEMVQIVRPEESLNDLEVLTSHAETLLQLLGLHYRVCELASGDLSFAAAKCYDLEVWAPGVGKYLEVSSCSNFGDFQARRMNLRFRPTEGEKPIFPHTLNGSGLALPRTVIAIMESYQTADGKIVVPEVLRPYMRGLEIIG